MSKQTNIHNCIGKGRLIKACECCGQVFRTNREAKRFCNDDCSIEFKNRTLTENRPIRPKTKEEQLLIKQLVAMLEPYRRTGRTMRYGNR